MRFKELELSELSAQQRRIADDIAAGPRGALRDRSQRLGGLFNVMIRAPGLADHAQKVGAYLRFDSSLDARISEFAIIITARHWNSPNVWTAHLSLALKAGLDPRTALDLAVGKMPGHMQGDEADAYRYCQELHETRYVSDATYQATLARFGEQGVIDLTGVAGYYTLASMMQNINCEPFSSDTPLPMPSQK